MHGRNVRLGQDSNQRPCAPKANTITTDLKRILSNAAVRYCITGIRCLVGENS